MAFNKLTLALGLSLLASPALVFAQDAAPKDSAAEQKEEATEAESTSNWSWTAAVTSDYVYRGITQTDFGSAVQGSIGYAFGDTGIYTGVWTSNVDFGSGGPNIEFDVYGGWAKDLSDDWNLDLVVTRYIYYGEQDYYPSFDFTQFDGKVTFKEMLTFTYSYADDYSGLGFDYQYYALSGTYPIGAGWNIDAAYGHTVYGDNNGDYDNYNLGVSRQFGLVNAAIGYYDTNFDGFNASDSWILTFSFGG